MNLRALRGAESEGAGARRGTRRARTGRSLDRAKERDLGRESASLRSGGEVGAEVSRSSSLVGNCDDSRSEKSERRAAEEENREV